MFSTPLPEPGHFAHPGRKARLAALNDYNAQLTRLRNHGIKDHAGHRNFGAERELRMLLTDACNQLSRTDTLEVVERIISETAKKIAELPQVTQISKAA